MTLKHIVNLGSFPELRFIHQIAPLSQLSTELGTNHHRRELQGGYGYELLITCLGNQMVIDSNRGNYIFCRIMALLSMDVLSSISH